METTNTKSVKLITLNTEWLTSVKYEGEKYSQKVLTIASNLEEEKADVICLQEVTKESVEDMLKHMQPVWKMYMGTPCKYTGHNTCILVRDGLIVKELKKC